MGAQKGLAMKDRLTDKELRKKIREAVAAKQQLKASDGGVKGAGVLMLYVRPSGAATWYYRHGTRAAREELPVGPCDPDGKAGFSLAQARARADELTKLVLSGVPSLAEHFAAQEAAKKAAAAALREAEAEAKADAERRATRTLRALLTAYSDHLKAQNKPSWREALAPLRHVPKTVLDLAAADVTTEHLLSPLRALIDAGKGVTARIVRAYLRAAYALAGRADFDPTVPEPLRGFGVDANPVDRIPASGLAGFKRAGQRVLSWPELIRYRQRVEKLGDATTKDSLMLALLLGGQRLRQLARVKHADVDLHGRTISLRDPKGRRLQPRLHTLPLEGRAFELVKRRTEAPVWRRKPKTKAERQSALEQEGAGATPPAANRPLLSHRDRVPVDDVILSKTVSEIAAAMVGAGEARAPFRGGDIRRTAETLLAGMRVPRDVRAHLLSHGVSGVQAIHYDRHDYMEEMRAVLEQWEVRLYAENADVAHG